MRYIDFVEPQDESWNGWKVRCEEARDKVIQEVGNGSISAPAMLAGCPPDRNRGRHWDRKERR